MIMTETKTYKKTKIKTKTQRHKDTDKDRNKVLPRPNVCYIYQKQGVQEFECDIGCLLVTKTQFYALVELNIFQG